MKLKSKLTQVFSHDEKSMKVSFENQLFVEGDVIAEDAPLSKQFVISSQEDDKYTLTVKGEGKIEAMDTRSNIVFKLVEVSKKVSRDAVAKERKPLTLQVTMDRVLIEPISTEENEKLVTLDKTSKANIESVKLAKGLVVNVGPGKDGKPVAFVPGDIVYMFPNSFEADITVDNVLYLVYKELNLVIKEVAPIVDNIKLN